MSRDIYRHIKSVVLSRRPPSTSVEDGELAVAYHTDDVGVYLRDSLGKIRKVGPAYVGEEPPTLDEDGYTSFSNGELWIDSSGATPVLKFYDESLDEWTGTNLLDSYWEEGKILVGTSEGEADRYTLSLDSFFIDNEPGYLEVRIADSPKFGSYEFTSAEDVKLGTDVFTYTIPNADLTWTELEAFDTTLYRSAKYLVEARVGPVTEVSEILLVHNGEDVYITEYGNLITGDVYTSLGTYRAEIVTVGEADLVSFQFQRKDGVLGDIVIRSVQTHLM